MTQEAQNPLQAPPLESDKDAYQQVLLLLSEKRTAHTTLRTGIAVAVLPLTVLSFLIVMSSHYSLPDNALLLTLVIIGCCLFIALGTFLVLRGLMQIHFYDKRMGALMSRHKEIRGLFFRGIFARQTDAFK